MFVALEHANLSVLDIDATVRFLLTAFPEFSVRGGSPSDDPNRWVHVGTDESYIALSRRSDTGHPSSFFNHVGFVVTDADELKQRMLSAGYREGYRAESHPHRKRVYFLDDEGVEWEFIQYMSDDPRDRNDYSM